MNCAAKHGFYFHHSHKDDNYVLMCKWVDETMGNRLPAYADRALHQPTPELTEVPERRRQMLSLAGHAAGHE